MRIKKTNIYDISLKEYENRINKPLIRVYYQLKKEFIESKKNFEDSILNNEMDIEIKEYLHQKLKSSFDNFELFNNKNEEELIDSLTIIDSIKKSNFIKNNAYYISLDMENNQLIYTFS